MSSALPRPAQELLLGNHVRNFLNPNDYMYFLIHVSHVFRNSFYGCFGYLEALMEGDGGRPGGEPPPIVDGKNFKSLLFCIIPKE